LAAWAQIIHMPAPPPPFVSVLLSCSPPEQPAIDRRRRCRASSRFERQADRQADGRRTAPMAPAAGPRRRHGTFFNCRPSAPATWMRLPVSRPAELSGAALHRGPSPDPACLPARLTGPPPLRARALECAISHSSGARAPVPARPLDLLSHACAGRPVTQLAPAEEWPCYIMCAR
jgi:hypothetical protein